MAEIDVAQPTMDDLYAVLIPAQGLAVVASDGERSRFIVFGWADTLDGERVIAYECRPTGVLFVTREDGGHMYEWAALRAWVLDEGEPFTAQMIKYGVACAAAIKPGAPDAAG